MVWDESDESPRLLDATTSRFPHLHQNKSEASHHQGIEYETGTQCRHLLEICFKNRERLDLRTSGLKYGMEGHKFKLNLQYVCKS